MAKLADLNSRVRKGKVTDALNGVLRQLDKPASTSEIVVRVAALMGADDERDLIARDVVKLTKEHPFARQTGDTFVKYGKTMQRWEWLPSHAKRKPSAVQLTPEEIERRRNLIAADEAEDEWTVHPASTDLEDEE